MSWVRKRRRYRRWCRYYMRYPRLTQASFSVPRGMVRAGVAVRGTDDDVCAPRRRVWYP
jgi:hypothetical protein